MGDYRSTRGENRPATNSERLLIRKKIYIGITATVGALCAAGLFINVPRRVPASGYATTSPYAEVRSAVAGRVEEIKKFSGDDIKVGDELVLLDHDIESAAAKRAEIEEAGCRAELEYSEAKILEERRAHSNSVAIAAISLEYAKKRLEITKQLTEKGLAASRELMSDTHNVNVATLEYCRLNDSELPSIGDRHLELLKTRLLAAGAAMRGAKAALDARVVRAPSEGRLFRHTFYIGEVVRPDQVLYEIFGTERKLLRLRVPERYATRVHIGQPIRAQFRTSKKLLTRNWVFGEIAELRDTIQADGNETYRVLYCTYDPAELDVPPGTTADAEILIGSVPLWKAVFDH